MLKGEVERLSQEVASTRQLIDQSHAVNRTAADRLRVAEDRLLEAEEQIKKLQVELADTEQQLSSLQRKYTALKDGQAAATAVAAAAAAAEPTAAANAAPSASTSMAADASLQEEMLEEVQQLQQQLDKRVQDLEKEKESHFKTKRGEGQRRCVHLIRSCATAATISCPCDSCAASRPPSIPSASSSRTIASPPFAGS